MYGWSCTFCLLKDIKLLVGSHEKLVTGLLKLMFLHLFEIDGSSALHILPNIVIYISDTALEMLHSTIWPCFRDTQV